MEKPRSFFPARLLPLSKIVQCQELKLESTLFSRCFLILVSLLCHNIENLTSCFLFQRLDILEALEAAVGDLNDVGMGNHIFQVQRDFNE